MFCKADTITLKNVMMFLNSYGSSLGQLINYAKSNFVFVNDFMSFIKRVKYALKCSNETIPFVYLGVPIFVSALKPNFLYPL